MYGRFNDFEGHFAYKVSITYCWIQLTAPISLRSAIPLSASAPLELCVIEALLVECRWS